MRYSIKRLPLWGEQTEDENSEIESGQINFQWPTQSMLNDMPEDVSLSTLTLKYNKDSLPILSIQCTLKRAKSDKELLKEFSTDII